MEIDVATAWEMVADTVPDQLAVVQGEKRYSYRSFDEHAARFAAALAAAGVTLQGKVAIYMYNAPEYLICQFGSFKTRAIPINVNYRYLDDELAYLLDNSDAEAIVFHSSLGDRVGRVRPQMTNIKLYVEVSDSADHLEGAVRFEDLMANYEPQARQIRSSQDIAMTYTGGTTGMPKGVMSKQGPNITGVYASSTITVPTAVPPTKLEEIVPFIRDMAEIDRIVAVPCCPLMHATGMGVGAVPALTRGGTVVLLKDHHFDAHELWQTVEAERVSHIVIVGDPFARPMTRALAEREADGRPYDVSSVRSILSAGAIWSAEMKESLTNRMSATMHDLLGSTEGGIYALSIAAGRTNVATAHFSLSPGTRILTEDGRDVVPGSGEAGLLATETRTIGYYKDPEKTAKTFREIDGKHYVFTGDWATADADGSITLLGRGSNCINTGGEKVYPEEVEEAIKRHPSVDDCLVVGVADEQFGQRVMAVAGSSVEPAPSGEEIRAWLRDHLSHFKIPREILVTSHVKRAPNGKADYGWARETIAAAEVS